MSYDGKQLWAPCMQSLPSVAGFLINWLSCCGKTEQPQRTQAPAEAANMQKDVCPDDVVSMSVLWSVVNRQLFQVKQGMHHVNCISLVNE